MGYDGYLAGVAIGGVVGPCVVIVGGVTFTELQTNCGNIRPRLPECCSPGLPLVRWSRSVGLSECGQRTDGKARTEAANSGRGRMA